MDKLFSVDYRLRSTADNFGNIPTNTGATLIRNIKGISARSTAGLFTYPSVDLGTDDFSIILWLDSVDWHNVYIANEYIDGSNKWDLRTNLAGALEFVSFSSGNPALDFDISFNLGLDLKRLEGQPVCIQLNVERNVGVTGYVNQWAAVDNNFSDSGVALSVDSLTIGGHSGWVEQYNTNTHVYKAEIYSGIMSNAEMLDEYQRFLHSSLTSTPTTIRHHIPVDLANSVLCHDYQRGSAVDLSGNGNNGVVNGFVDWSGVDGARFDGSTGYVESNNTGMADTNYFIEMLIRPHDVNNPKYICDQGGSNRRAIVIGNQNGYFNFYDGIVGYPTGLPVDTQIPAYLDQWQYLVMGTDGTKVYGYSNGVKIVEEIGTWEAPAGIGFMLGCSGVYTRYSNIDVKFINIHNIILTESQIKANYNKIAGMIDLNCLGDNLLPDNRVYTVGQRVEI